MSVKIGINPLTWTNDDLPEDSSYRQVTPMALTIRVKDRIAHMAPLRIDYEKFNDPEVNAFFREAVSTKG